MSISETFMPAAKAAALHNELEAVLRQLGVWDEVSGLVEDAETAAFDHGQAEGWDRCATAHHLPTD